MLPPIGILAPDIGQDVLIEDKNNLEIWWTTVRSGQERPHRTAFGGFAFHAMLALRRRATLLGPLTSCSRGDRVAALLGPASQSAPRVAGRMRTHFFIEFEPGSDPPRHMIPAPPREGWEMSDFAIEQVSACSGGLLGGALPSEVVIETIAHASRAAIPIAWNAHPQHFDLLTNVGENMTFVQLDEGEALKFTGCKNATAVELIQVVAAMTRAFHVCVTLGARGAMGMSQFGRPFHVPAPDHAPHRPVGLGDRHAAFVTWALVNGKSLHAAMWFARRHVIPTRASIRPPAEVSPSVGPTVMFTVGNGREKG